MNWFTNMFKSSARDGADDFWYQPVGHGTAAGVSVTPERALQVPAVLDCLKVLSEPIASLPLEIYRRDSEGNKRRATDHPLYNLLHTQPNAHQTAYEFRGAMQWNLAFHRNAYAEITPGMNAAIGALTPLHPSLVRPYRRDNGEVWYEVRDRPGGARHLHADEVWHLKAHPMDASGLAGLPVLDTNRETIAAALALQDYGARFFANDGQSGGILEMENHFSDPDQKEKFLASWRKKRTGKNQHRDALLEHGIKYNRQTVNNEQAQFLETRQHLAVELARIWRVQPHKIGILDRATFSNIEQQALEFVTDTMLPWFALWEQAVSRDLLIPGRGGVRYYAEFNVAGLLRGDLLNRYRAYAIARNWGWLSVNEIRKLENLNPIENGDTYLQPTNMAPVDAPEAMRADGASPRPDTHGAGEADSAMGDVLSLFKDREGT